MKHAQIAYQETVFQSDIIKLEEDINTSIDEAISEGKYYCSVDFNTDLPNEIRLQIVKELHQAGYYYEMPKLEKRPAGCPAEQWRYYDCVYISWDIDSESTIHNRLIERHNQTPNLIWGWEDEDEI